MMHRALWVVALLIGCPSPDDDDSGPDSGDTEVDTGLRGKAGSIVVALFLDDAYYAEDGVLAGLFLDDTLGAVNLAECALISEGCITGLPGEDDWVALADGPSFDPDTAVFWDVGQPVTVGDYFMNRSPAFEEAIVYTGQFNYYNGGTIDVAWPGADWTAYRGTGVATLPDPIVLSSPSPTRALPAVGPTDTIDLRWTPGGAGEVVLRVLGPQEPRLYHLADDGAFTLSLSEVPFEHDLAGVVLRLGRWTTTRLEAAGNTVDVHALVDQHLYGDYANLDARLPLAFADTCEAAVDLTPIATGSFHGDLTSSSDAIDLGDSNACTGYPTAGGDGIVRVVLPPGGALDVEFLQYPEDGAVYLLTECGVPASCVTGADNVLDGLEESLSWTNDTTSTQDLWLVLDAWSYSGPFTVDVTVTE